MSPPPPSDQLLKQSSLNWKVETQTYNFSSDAVKPTLGPVNLQTLFFEINLENGVISHHEKPPNDMVLSSLIHSFLEIYLHTCTNMSPRTNKHTEYSIRIEVKPIISWRVFKLPQRNIKGLFKKVSQFSNNFWNPENKNPFSIPGAKAVFKSPTWAKCTYITCVNM